MRFGLLTFISLAVPATAGELSLSSPIDCDLNGPCYIQQYVDHDASKGASDFTCSGLSYDGHKGTDFALPTWALMYWRPPPALLRVCVTGLRTFAIALIGPKS